MFFGKFIPKVQFKHGDPRIRPRKPLVPGNGDKASRWLILIGLSGALTIGGIWVFVRIVRWAWETPIL